MFIGGTAERQHFARPQRLTSFRVRDLRFEQSNGVIRDCGTQGDGSITRNTQNGQENAYRNDRGVETLMCQKLEPRASDYRCDYATHADFCNALVENTDHLYLLAFLLMTNHADAEGCFVATVERALRPNTVFKEWVASWTRRTLITFAIDNTNFNTTGADQREPDPWSASQTETGSVIHAIARLLFSTVLYLSCRFLRATQPMNAHFYLVFLWL